MKKSEIIIFVLGLMCTWLLLSVFVLVAKGSPDTLTNPKHSDPEIQKQIELDQIAGVLMFSCMNEMSRYIKKEETLHKFCNCTVNGTVKDMGKAEHPLELTVPEVQVIIRKHALECAPQEQVKEEGTEVKPTNMEEV